MRVDGFSPIIQVAPIVIGATKVQIIPHSTGSASDIDSAIVIKYKDAKSREHCVVNANDIIFDEGMLQNLKIISGDVDILLCGYTGAGPYPQTYFDVTDATLQIEADNKKILFFKRYKELISKINAKVNIPFAGKYILGGRLAYLNDYRGVADPVEILEIDSRACVLADGGGKISTLDLLPSGTRVKKYLDSDVRDRIQEIKEKKMDYERLIAESEISQLPLKRLLFSAVRNAIKKSECDEDYFFALTYPAVSGQL